jgi:hypothetical protein
LVTLAPLAIIILAIVSYLGEEGPNTIYWALAAMVVGAVLYIPLRLIVKPGVPDVDPFVASGGE